MPRRKLTLKTPLPCKIPLGFLDVRDVGPACTGQARDGEELGHLAVQFLTGSVSHQPKFLAGLEAVGVVIDRGEAVVSVLAAPDLVTGFVEVGDHDCPRSESEALESPRLEVPDGVADPVARQCVEIQFSRP